MNDPLLVQLRRPAERTRAVERRSLPPSAAGSCSPRRRLLRIRAVCSSAPDHPRRRRCSNCPSAPPSNRLLGPGPTYTAASDNVFRPSRCSRPVLSRPTLRRAGSRPTGSDRPALKPTGQRRGLAAGGSLPASPPGSGDEPAPRSCRCRCSQVPVAAAADPPVFPSAGSPNAARRTHSAREANEAVVSPSRQPGRTCGRGQRAHGRSAEESLPDGADDVFLSSWRIASFMFSDRRTYIWRTRARNPVAVRASASPGRALPSSSLHPG